LRRVYVNQRCFISIAIVLLVFTCNLFPQIVLEGTVSTPGMDPEPVQNALVELIDQADTTRVFSSTTDEKGHYSIQITQTGIGEGAAQKPGAFNLYQNYPNPFNPTTVISYELPHPADVRIEIYNVLGQKIKTLFDGYQSNLVGRVVWDGTNDRGQGVSTGVYIYSLTSEGIRINKKMLLIDGHTGISNLARLNTTGPAAANKNVLNKPLSNNFLLRITGTDLETWEQRNLQITGSKVIDVTLYRTITDIDGNVYRIIKIGTQWWMAENLKVTHYRNGDAIPNVTDDTEWAGLTTGAYCYYENSSSYAADYGALYNWYAVKDSRNIAPEGWHVPSEAEWQTLTDYLGGYNVAGGKLKETGTDHWLSPNTGATNESGFTALPAGWCSPYYGDFSNMGYKAVFWSATEDDSSTAWCRGLGYSDAVVSPLHLAHKQAGFSVRCVMDTGAPATLSSIKITPATATLSNAETCKFTCTATYSDQRTKDATAAAVWSVSPGFAGSIDVNGLFTAHATNTGTETITATYLGQTNQVTVIVLTTGTVTDIDGNVYKTVKIGNQWWMAENLKVMHYRNNDPIDYVIDDTDWANLTTGAYCYYDNNSSHSAVYGALYNWYAVEDSRNIAPAGWHVPTDDEWKQLEMVLGMSQTEADSNGIRGTDEGGKLKETGTSHWKSPNTGSTNESGFTALPGGYRNYYGSFSTMGYYAVFWLTTDSNSFSAWHRKLSYNSVNIDRSSESKKCGFSIRCVKD